MEQREIAPYFRKRYQPGTFQEYPRVSREVLD